MEKYTIEKLGAFGEGVARNGKVVFVKGALPGEVVLAETVLEKKSFLEAELKKTLVKSKDRVDPPCPYFYSCGGCAIMHMKYDAQLSFKVGCIEETLFKVAGISTSVNKIVPSPEIFRYRNKLSFPVRNEKIGLYTENSHDVVDISDCLLQKEWNKRLIEALRRFLKDYGFQFNDERHGIRHLVAREKNGSVCIVLVTAQNVDVSRFFDYVPLENFALYQNINNGVNNVILGDEYRFIGGKGVLPSFHPASFYQVNDGIEKRLYDDVAAACEGELVVDAYCGAGNLTLKLAKKARCVYGIEIVSEAVDEAKRRANSEGADNVSFICGACERELPRLASRLIENGDMGAEKRTNMTIVLDPPRKGCDQAVLRAAIDLAPEKIIYVSCNPATLARDLKLLTSNYDIASLTAYDMFPHTPHVETLVVLSHKKPDGHIGVKVEFGEEEGQISLKEAEKRAEERKPKEKVTYKMIQEYIEKTYGFKVHTAYIAEVKRDLGLPMYDASNAVEELKRPRSHPSPQMVEAIKETLKHFEII